MPPKRLKFNEERFQSHTDTLRRLYNHPRFRQAVQELGIDPLADSDMVELLFLLLVIKSANPDGYIWEGLLQRTIPVQ